MLKKIGISSAIIATAILPLIASADAFSTTTAQSTIDTFISDLGAMIAYVLTAAFVLGAALIGLWYGVRKLLRFLK